LPDIIRVADEYYVRASSALADNRTRVLKYGDTFAVFNRYGDIEALGPSQFWLFHSESRHLSRFTLQLCRITTSSDSFNGWLVRSSADLRMLAQGNPEGPYSYGGVPSFSTVFGRDGIITALECLWMTPEFAEGVLKYLSETQATVGVPEQDAEPGKILHEMRRGEIAATREALVTMAASTPRLCLSCWPAATSCKTGNLSFVKEIWPSVKRALGWIDEFGDRRRFVEYEKPSQKGLVQQGWKDSHDSIFHADGSMAEPPIALCEVQGYVYSAKHYASRIARALQEPEVADRLEREAEALRAKFEEAFWCDDLRQAAQ
jgi:glycogen debranching enzyme